jgi:hypothetical protein
VTGDPRAREGVKSRGPSGGRRIRRRAVWTAARRRAGEVQAAASGGTGSCLATSITDYADGDPAPVGRGERKAMTIALWPLVAVVGAPVIVATSWVPRPKITRGLRTTTRVFYCPVRQQHVRVDLQTTRSGKAVGVVGCSAFTPPIEITCGRFCLRPAEVPSARAGRSQAQEDYLAIRRHRSERPRARFPERPGRAGCGRFS